jgi:hypothetical protein
VAVTAFEVSLSHLLQRFQEIGIQRGQHKTTAQTAFKTLLNTLMTQCNESSVSLLSGECHMMTVICQGVNKKVLVIRSQLQWRLSTPTERRPICSGWHRAITSMSAANKPLAYCSPLS